MSEPDKRPAKLIKAFEAFEREERNRAIRHGWKRDREQSDMTEKPEPTKKIRKTEESDVRKSSTLDPMSQPKVLDKQAQHITSSLTSLEKKTRHLNEVLENGSTLLSALTTSLDASSAILHTLDRNFEQQKKDLREYREQVKELAEMMKNMNAKIEDEEE